jgi:hypothetical protein
MSGSTPEQLETAAAGSIGAQIILDYNEDGSKGARGGAGRSIEENIAARDAHLVALGLDPAAPSGPPNPEGVGARYIPPPDGKASRTSSLAAGISAEDLPPPAATIPPVNVDVPYVGQSGDTLTCTMGNWQGEPTAYAYQWKIDGTNVSGNASSYSVQAGDIGKTATCVVTATNAAGSATAPPSNGVTIADPAASRGRK